MMRIFLLGVNCILITSRALLRSVAFLFRRLARAIDQCGAISGAPATRSVDDTDKCRREVSASLHPSDEARLVHYWGNVAGGAGSSLTHLLILLVPIYLNSYLRRGGIRLP